MTITAHAGPLVVFPDSVNGANPELGPSLFTQGAGVLDPRPFYTYEPGQNFGAVTAGWGLTSDLVTLNAIPFTATANLIAANQHTTNGTPMTLASSTADGLGVGASILRADTGALVTGLLEIDPPVAQVTATIAAGSTTMTVSAVAAPGGHAYNLLSPGMVLSGTSIAANTIILGFGSGGGGLGTYILNQPPTAAIAGGTITAKGIGLSSIVGATGTTYYDPHRVPFGTAGTIQLWNPAALLSRVLVITADSASAATTTFTVRGYDTSYYAQTEQITVTPGSALSTNGVKAWKWIQSITPNATEGTHNFEVGTIDTVGFPIRSDNFQIGIPGPAFDVNIMFNNATIASATGYTAAVLTTPTATTGDVRGTYALQTSSNGTLRLVVSQSPKLGNFQSIAGLYGNTNYSDF